MTAPTPASHARAHAYCSSCRAPIHIEVRSHLDELGARVEITSRVSCRCIEARTVAHEYAGQMQGIANAWDTRR